MTAALIVAGIWAALFFAWTAWAAELWIVAVIFCFTVPALFDLLRNPASGLRLDDHALYWQTGRREATVALSELDHIQLNTRLDFSVSATAVLTTGRKIKIPFECTPPYRDFEEQLKSQNIKVIRHHFQLMQ